MSKIQIIEKLGFIQNLSIFILFIEYRWKNCLKFKFVLTNYSSVNYR